jgi:glutamyl-tRNA synthetase
VLDLDAKVTFEESVSPIVRFAPSPTGRLHIGNARTALLNALFARREGGTFILRFDDTDAARSRREFADSIERDLAWLGIPPDQTYRQSERFSFYREVADRLRAQGRLYPCYETPEELERRRRIQLSRGLPPVYDRAALALTPQDRENLESQGRNAHWRFRMDPVTITFVDAIRGPVSVDCASLSDPVLVREDGTWLYTLPSVADDIAFGITHIIRGEDHVTNSAVQIQIFEALDAKAPIFAHHNLLTTASGEGLSKRLGHLSLASLREAGYEPEAVASLAVLVGSSEPVRAIADHDELGACIDFTHISRAPAKFGEQDLDHLNARLLHDASFGQVCERLAGTRIDDRLWLAIRANLTRLNEAPVWGEIVYGSLPSAIEQSSAFDSTFLMSALATLPAEPWDESTWKLWTEAVKAATGLKGKALFLPLRLALTSLDHGPELATLLPLIGFERTKQRLLALRRAGQ